MTSRARVPISECHRLHASDADRLVFGAAAGTHGRSPCPAPSRSRARGSAQVMRREPRPARYTHASGSERSCCTAKSTADPASPASGFSQQRTCGLGRRQSDAGACAPARAQSRTWNIKGAKSASDRFNDDYTKEKLAQLVLQLKATELRVEVLGAKPSGPPRAAHYSSSPPLLLSSNRSNNVK